MLTFFSVVSIFYTFGKASFEEKGFFVLPRISLNQIQWSYLILTQGMTVKSAVKVYSFSPTIGWVLTCQSVGNQRDWTAKSATLDLDLTVFQPSTDLTVLSKSVALVVPLWQLQASSSTYLKWTSAQSLQRVNRNLESDNKNRIIIARYSVKVFSIILMILDDLWSKILPEIC